MRSVMLALLVLLVVAPAGQALRIEAHPPTGLGTLDPDQEAEGTVDVTVRCDDPLTEPMAERTLVHEMITGHPGLVASGPSTFPLPEDLCLPGGTQETDVEVPYTLVGSMDVPGEAPIMVNHTFSIEGGQANRAWALEHIAMAWRSRFDVVQHDVIQEGGPQRQLSYDLTITNHGNALSKFYFELVDPPREGDVVLPSPIVIHSPNEGHETTKTVTVTYLTPFKNGDNQANETFAIRIVPQSVKHTSLEGEGQEVEFTGVTDGVYVPSPLALVPMALAIAALIRRRR